MNLSRRGLFQSAGVVAAVPLFKVERIFGDGQAIRTYDGTRHDVSPDWYAANVEPFPHLRGLGQDGIDRTRQYFLALSTYRARRIARGRTHQELGTEAVSAVRRTLTFSEAAELEAVTKFHNVNSAWGWLQDRHYDEVGFFYLDQVHGGSHTHSCGCTTQHIVEHYKLIAGEPVEFHPHYPTKSCDRHRHLVGNFRSHWDTVYADNRSAAVAAA